MKFEVPVQSEHIRSQKDPFVPDDRRVINATVRLSDIPAFPLDPDPRVPKQKGPVVKKIYNSAQSNDGKFHLKNRGICLCVKSADYNNRTSVLTLDIPDPASDETYGIIDGGHTHHAIMSVVKEEQAKFPDQDVLDNQYVKLEIMVGVEGTLAEIAEARNYSVALKNWSLEGYMGKFEWLLKDLGDYKQYVRIKENEEQPVPIMDLIQVFCAINPNLFSESGGAVEAYVNAGKCLGYFVAEGDPHEFQKLGSVCRDIVRLHDYVRLHWKDRYNAEDDAGRRGKLGKRVEMDKRKRNRRALTTYYFLGQLPVEKDDFPVEKGFAIPIMSAFRGLLTKNTDGNYKWLSDPFDFYDKYGTEMVREVMEASNRADNDAHRVGRDKNIYRMLHYIARNKFLESVSPAHQTSVLKMEL